MTESLFKPSKRAEAARELQQAVAELRQCVETVLGDVQALLEPATKPGCPR